jgi:hypothetical protein
MLDPERREVGRRLLKSGFRVDIAVVAALAVIGVIEDGFIPFPLVLLALSIVLLHLGVKWLSRDKR